VVVAPGGGGYGKPARRPRAALDADMREGYVSKEAARTAYGIEV
jgi:N-methylhydantoinase B